MSRPIAVNSRETVSGPVAFRPDIEGLRAVAVVAVTIFHAFPRALPGGFTGVDVFFVISGFLITQLILREVEITGRLDLAGFWARRIRRILPVATLVLCAVALAALLFPAIDARLLGRQITAAALFYFNWRQAEHQVDYLADEGENPLLHYWSLSVEEQFYLVWPFALALAAWALAKDARRRRVALAAVCSLLLVGSFLVCVDTVADNRSLAFFSTITRSWQLLTGALLACVLVYLPLPGARLANATSLGAVALLLGGFAAISAVIAYPGWAAWAPTGATALLIYAGASPARSLVKSALSLPPVRYVGRISFSWYLWHWPALVFVSLSPFAEHAYGIPAAIAGSFLLAAATYHLVESPVRSNARLKASLSSTYLLGAALLLIGAGAGIGMRHYAPDTVHVGNGQWISRDAIKKDRPRIYDDRCLLRFDQVDYPPCAYGAPDGVRHLVLVGDSHAANWFTPIDAAARAAGWKLSVRIKAACPPNDAPPLRADGTRYPECTSWREKVMTEVEAIKPDLVIVGSGASKYAPELERSILTRLAAATPNLILLRGTPVLPEAPARCLSRATPEACVWDVAELLAAGRFPMTEAAALPKNARIIDFNDRLCPHGTCRAVTGGRVIMFDEHHLSDSYSATFAAEFEKLLDELR